MRLNDYNTAADILKDRRSYVEGLKTALNAFQDFEDIRFAWSIKNDAEYVRIQDAIEPDTFLHVEGMTKAEIFREICKVVLSHYVAECIPERLITDPELKREIIPLFNREVM